MNMKLDMSKLTEAEMVKRGALLAQVLKLRRDHDYHDRWQTAWGNKTDLGLYLTVERIMEEGE